jgi:hypothetical protein
LQPMQRDGFDPVGGTPTSTGGTRVLLGRRMLIMRFPSTIASGIDQIP